MALELKNFYSELVSEHYDGIVHLDLSLMYHHFVFEHGEQSPDQQFSILCEVLTRVCEANELILLDYHYSAARPQIVSLCNQKQIKYRSSNNDKVLSLKLTDPRLFLEFVPLLRNEDNLFLRFVEKGTADVAIPSAISTASEEAYVLLIGAGMRKVAFLSLNPTDLEVVSCIPLPQPLLSELNS